MNRDVVTTTIENVSAAEVSRILAERGIPPDKRVTVLVDEDLADVARRIRERAAARGMTEEIFRELSKEP